MGSALSIDATTNIIFCITMGAIAVITIVWTFKLTRRYRRLSGSDEEQVLSEDGKSVSLTTGSESSYASLQTQYSTSDGTNCQCGIAQSTSTTTQGTEGVIDSAHMAEVHTGNTLQGIGESFPEEETVDFAQAFGRSNLAQAIAPADELTQKSEELADILAEMQHLGREPGNAIKQQRDHHPAPSPRQMASSKVDGLELARLRKQ